jgi:hypothetical protein
MRAAGFAPVGDDLSIAVLDPLGGYALDVAGMYNINGLLRTEDGGIRWQSINVPISRQGRGAAVQS